MTLRDGSLRGRGTQSLVCCCLALVAACGSAPTAPLAPDAAPVTPGVPNLPGSGVSARFVRTGYAVTGVATLRMRGDTAQLDFSSDFSIGNTPGPFVYLNTNRDANQGAPLRVGALRSRTGAQTYTFLVPAGVRYTHVLIWCDPFNVAMAEAVLP
jgi:hypothetical protein